jgi:hypothetical protein
VRKVVNVRNQRCIKLNLTYLDSYETTKMPFTKIPESHFRMCISGYLNCAVIAEVTGMRCGDGREGRENNLSERATPTFACRDRGRKQKNLNYNRNGNM